MGAKLPTSREQIFQAIFVRLQTADGFTTFSRRMIDYSVIPPGIMPICILWEQPEIREWDGRGLPKDYLHAQIVIVFQNPSKPQGNDPTTAVPGATIINPLVDAIHKALLPDDPQFNSLTLGGLVHWVRIDGHTIIETGDTDANGIGGAVMQLRILVPSFGQDSLL